MNLRQSPGFKRIYKKLHAAQRPGVNAALDAIIADPSLGDMKVGDLAGVRVHKFRIAQQLMLLAYQVEGDTLHLLFMGTHENFYRDLKN